MKKPTILLIRPYAGHTARLMERTVKTLSQDFNVVMTEIPHDTYEQYLIELRKLVLQYDNIMGVCQGGVGALMALGLQDGVEVKNKRLALLGTPVDTEAAPSTVSQFVQLIGVDGLINMFSLNGKISGLALTFGYMMLNPLQHYLKFAKVWTDLKTRKFYQMYFDTEDMSEEFFRESLEITFIYNMNSKSVLLLKNNIVISYKWIDPTNSLLVVEGTKDDITMPGQTRAVFDITPNIPDKKKTSLLVEAGHYGVFSGSKFDREVYPKLKEFFK